MHASRSIEVPTSTPRGSFCIDLGALNRWPGTFGRPQTSKRWRLRPQKYPEIIGLLV